MAPTARGVVHNVATATDSYTQADRVRILRSEYALRDPAQPNANRDPSEAPGGVLTTRPVRQAFAAPVYGSRHVLRMTIE